MFPRKKRIPRAAFPSVLSGGRRLSSEHFTAIFSSKEQGYAVVIPKKVAKLSVTRHRMKRRILGALKKLSLKGEPIPSALILFPKASAERLSSAVLYRELSELVAHMEGGRRKSAL